MGNTEIDSQSTSTEKLPPALYVVSTPIGNLRDITLRALDILNAVDLILCEDTRTFSKLATRYGVTTKKQSFHEHNEDMLSASITSRIQGGERIALVTDAGTPLVSDPGYPLVRQARADGIEVFSIPGACAAIAALSASGFEPDRFLFAGFLPVKPGKKRKEIESLLALEVTLIYYESPHRLLATLELLHEIAPDREVCVARELTKLHESVIAGAPEKLLEHYRKHSPRGEIVLLIRRDG